MRKTMKKLTQGATRLLVLALGLGLTATGWAATLSSSGYISTDSANPTAVFSGVAITDIALGKYVLSGNIGGGNVNTDGEAGAYNYSVVAVDNVNSISSLTVQFQRIDDGYCKCVEVVFTESSPNVIKAYANRAGYKSGAALGGSSFDWYGTVVTDATSAGYGVYDLSLTLADQKPLAVWDGAKGDFKKTTVNNVTFDANGNTVPADGSYVKITGSLGALFDLGADYSYVVAEFTVTNLNETAAANRVLALWSPSAYDGITVGTTATLGVYLDSSARTTHGIWQSKTWSSSSSSIKSGVSQDSKRTFALTVEDSTVLAANDSKIGTHLFELTGDNPNTAIFGGSGNIGLRANQTYRLLSVGGLAKGTELSAFTDLVVTKVVIYASNHRQFTSGSSGIVDVASVENPTTVTVANGETISASTLNTETPVCVYTEAGATLNLDASLASSVYFFGSIAGDSTGLTLGSANDKVTLTNASYVPVIKGRGTVVYPDNTIPSSDSTGWLTSSDWAGTLSLSNISGTGTGQPARYTPFRNYGSANSTIKVAGFTGFFEGGNYESPATLEIAAGSTFTLNNGNNGNSMTFAKLTGSGDIVICGDNGPAVQYVMRDASEFAGSITVSQSGSSSFKKSIVLGGGSSYNYNVNNYQKQICVLGNVTIAAGKTWTADSGIVVNGTLTKTNSTATLSGTITGSGKIIYNDELPNSANFTANTWTGTVEVNGGSTTSAGIEAANATQFMNSGSKFTVASGTVTLDTAAGLTGTVDVNSGATLVVVDTTVTELSLNGTYDGNVNLAACSSLATLNLGCGSLRSLSKITFPSSLTTLNLTIAEDAREDGEVTMTLPTGSAVTTVSASVVDQNGVTKPTTATLNGSTVAITFSPTVTGDACWHAYEFNNNYTDSGTDQHDAQTWNSSTAGFKADTAEGKDNNYFIYTSSRPGPTSAFGYPAEWSCAIRCTAPQATDSIIVAYGNVNNGNYIALASGDAIGKMRLVHSSGNNPVQEIAEMTVANPTNAQHVYVFTKTASAVTVYCDGDLIVSKPLSLTIGSGFQFGTQYGGYRSGSGLAEVTNKDTGGMVDYTRLYNFAIGDSMIQKLANDDPYESSTPTYSRTMDDDAWWYTVDGTWLKSDDATLVGVPDVAGIVDLTATADATMTVNLPAAPVYEKLTFQGSGAVTLVKDGSSPKIATAKLVVKTNVTAPYDIADFSGARVSVDAGKVLTFDFSTYPLESVTGVTTQQVTGVTTRADDRYAVVASAKSAWNSNLSLVYDPVEYVYSVVIDPAALVTKNNTTVAYPTVADALTALSTDAGTVRLLVDYDQDITLSAGQTLDVGSTTYSGTASATGQYAELVHSGTTWKAVDNSVNTWKSSVTAGHWNTASNWENGVVPKTYTRVTFPANDDPEFTGYTVTVKIFGNNDVEWMPVCTGMVVNAKVDMVQDASGSDWGTIHLGGNISGTGTLALHKVGLYNSLGSSTPITVSCGLSVAIKDAANQDCYLYGGPFVFEGAVTATSNVLFKAEYCAATFNGLVVMEDGTTINGNGGTGTTVYNGGISVSADAAATLVGGNRVTIASTVTLAAGATLTIPNAASTSGATFATSVADSYVKATAGESTTVYSVAAKRTATVSVGANAALSINGNAVADGDAVKFVPGDVLTITASADTYYTPALTVNEVARTSPYQLTTTDADVTVSVTATLDTYTITIPVVANTTVSVSYTSGGAAQVATTAGDITVDAGTDVAANWTAASGYKITSGASQTLNAVTSAQTLASPTVEAMGATVSDVNFSYGADYATATVTATVTGDATSATLSYGNTTYNANVVNGTVTFENVAVTRGNDIYAPAGYTITAKDGETAVTTTGGSGTSVAADVVAVGWINENAETSGTSAGGSWTNAVTYANGKAEISDNRFEATTASTASRVVLEFNVCFSSASDADVEGEAQAAIKLGESGGATTFMVLASNAAWTPVSRGDFVPDASTTYKVVMTIDYGNGSYGVTVGDNVLTNAFGSASFSLAKSGATSVQNIDFAGSGTLTSLKGSQFEGYMVKDALNNFYATIQAATQAYNSANGPYTVLHDGTAPDGWKIDETTKALIKIAKGFFFMAY